MSSPNPIRPPGRPRKCEAGVSKTSISLSEKGAFILETLADENGISKSAVMEMALRHLARKHQADFVETVLGEGFSGHDA